MRKLSGKTINSLALCMALAAPIVYLFGTLFNTLAGSHGNQLIGQGLETTEYAEVHTYVNDGTRYKMEIDSRLEELIEIPLEGNTYYRYEFDYSLSTNVISGDFQVVRWGRYAANNMNYLNLGGRDLITYYFDTQSLTVVADYPFIVESTEFPVQLIEQFLPYVTLYKETTTLSPTLNNNTATYSDYLFGQFFAYDNFLAESGREVLNGTPLYGFEPIGELVRYTDANMLHLANLSYGPLVIGYTYYCAHVIIVDLIFYIGSFIPRLIKKTINKLEGGLE